MNLKFVNQIYFLKARGKHAETIGLVIAKIDKVFSEYSPDAVLI